VSMCARHRSPSWDLPVSGFFTELMNFAFMFGKNDDRIRYDVVYNQSIIQSFAQ